MKGNKLVQLTQDLIAFNSINPPGNEIKIAEYVGKLLSKNGFRVKYVPFEKNRINLIAEIGCSKDSNPTVFSGHFDTVPLGEKKWSVDPFGGKIKDGKIFGRGASDMKGGVAAMVIAAIEAFEEEPTNCSVRLVLTAGEELGCQGAIELVSKYNELGSAMGVIIGEPTNNIPAIGHKGGLYLNIFAKGITAHSSMPHLGDNAIYKAVHAISKIEKFNFNVENDDLLGMPTINVGKISGGMNINSVPDHASFTIDARTTTKVDHQKLIEKLKNLLGKDIVIEVLVNLPAIASGENNPFTELVYKACDVSRSDTGYPKSIPYLTDGAVLQHVYKNTPIIILGPGQPEMAHQTDEFCYIDKLNEAVKIYKKIILKKGKRDGQNP